MNNRKKTPWTLRPVYGRCRGIILSSQTPGGYAEQLYNVMYAAAFRSSAVVQSHAHNHCDARLYLFVWLPATAHDSFMGHS